MPEPQLWEAGLGEGASRRECPTRLLTSLRARFGELSHGLQAWASVGWSCQPRPSWRGVKGSSDSAWLGNCPTQHLLCPDSHVTAQRPLVLDPAPARRAQEHGDPCFPQSPSPYTGVLGNGQPSGCRAGRTGFGKGSRSLGHQLQLLPQVEFLPQGSHIPAHLFD